MAAHVQAHTCTMYSHVHTPALSQAQYTRSHGARMYTHTHTHAHTEAHYVYALLCEAESASQPEVSRVDVKQAGDQQA